MKLSFITPTQVDLRELFTLGLGSKRGDDTKIGHKGSGLKFSLALLHRYGSSLTVKVGGKVYNSNLRDVVIRDQAHRVIILVDETGDVTETGIALTAGEDTWTEPWFVLRELYQNMLDEGGSTSNATDVECPTGTVMTVELTPDLALAWDARFQWHHPRAQGILYVTPTGCKSGLYYHGFQILSEPSWKFSYDVTSIIERENLSEDRQARNLNYRDMFAKVVKAMPATPVELYAALVAKLNSGEPEDLELIERAIYNYSTPKGWSHLELCNAFQSQHGTNKAITNASTIGEREAYYCKAVGRDPVTVRWYLFPLLQNAHAAPTIASLLPNLHSRLKPVQLKRANKDVVTRLRTARRFCARLAPPNVEVQLVETLHDEDKGSCTAALAVPAENKVLVLLSYAERATVTELTKMFIEEFIHLRTSAPDCSLNMQEALISELAYEMMPKPRQGTSSEYSL